MKGKTLTYIILLATVSVAGVLSIQFFFLKNAYTYSEKQFMESVSVALREVTWQIMLANGNTSDFDSLTPVEMISKSDYMVHVDAIIDYELLKFHLIEELKKHQIFTAFEFAIYRPGMEMPEQKTLITTDGEEKASGYHFPQYKSGASHHFAVHFPDRSSYFYSRLSVWYLFTGLLVVVVVFFGYSLSVIIRQRQLSEIQKNFINNLTHELKTPISSIALSANVLKNKKILRTPEKLFEYARIIEDQNNRLSKNVEKVLNLASLEKNKLHLNKEETAIGPFLKETIAYFKQTDFGQKATIKLHISSSPEKMKADKFHFSNLIINILENSVKYCEKQPEIFIEVNQTKNTLHVRFQDNGIGISKKHRKKIFNRFYRVPTGNVHNVKGFGLGLDYVRKIVKAHKWKIKVNKNPEGGSIFTLLIPLKR